MKAAALALLLALPAQAQEDAPVLTPRPDALCLLPEEQVALARRLEYQRAVIAELRAAPQGVPVGVVVAIAIVGAVAAGAAAVAGFEAGRAVK